MIDKWSGHILCSNHEFHVLAQLYLEQYILFIYLLLLPQIFMVLLI